jgi:transcription elongation factor GreA
MSERVPMTKEAYEKLRAEVDRLQNVTMLEVAKRIATAREMGDLSENAEYHAAREDQGQLQAKIDVLKDKLARAQIVDPTQLPAGVVVFGSRVRIKDVGSGEVDEYQLVGPGEEDYENNKILTSSPRGKGLIGKKVGDIAEITVPKGTLRYEILDISTPNGSSSE